MMHTHHLPPVVKLYAGIYTHCTQTTSRLLIYIPNVVFVHNQPIEFKKEKKIIQLIFILHNNMRISLEFFLTFILL